MRNVKDGALVLSHSITEAAENLCIIRNLCEKTSTMYSPKSFGHLSTYCFIHSVYILRETCVKISCLKPVCEIATNNKV